jgi:DNA-binding transcriptional MerR regulator
MRIGCAAQLSGASVRSLRYHEDEGLITPGRLGNGYRDYCPSTLSTVRQIRSLLEAGLPVRLIREALPYLEDGQGDALCEPFRLEVERYRDRLAAQIAGMEAQRSALDAFLRGQRT